MTAGTVAGRLADIRSRIAGAAARAGRRADEVRLVAVSKTFGADAVREAATAGQVDFGENKVQEALAKAEATRDLPLTWHLIGHLQSNKAKKAAAHFHWIHAVDGVDLLRKLDQAAAAAGTAPRLLVQADLALEPTKHGASEDELPAIFAAAADCTAARVVGLMLLPPWTENPEDVRPWFRRLREIRDGLAARGVPAAQLAELSMGMSHDFEVAVEEGATIVRVGTAIFGSRT
ncbi:MAG: YggS family pyridoxal phosphate-dependent enzyme [Vicinamibacteria bacterium]